MRIIRLQVNNVLNLRAIDVRPGKHVNKVSGKNGAGKSNLLETIRFSLLGKRAMPPRPLREGQKKGDIEVDIGDYIVKVSITKRGEYWLVTDKQGNPVKSPQSLLKEIVGPISFDPLALLDTEPKKLREVLLKLVGVDLDKYDTDIKEQREERTRIGRFVKAAEAVRNEKTYHDDAPKEETSAVELAKNLDEARQNNQQIEHIGNAIDNALATIAHLQETIKDHEARIEGWREQLQSNTIINIAELEQKLANIEATNKRVRENSEYTAADDAYKQKTAEYEALTDRIEALEADKQNELEEATMPIDGLAVTDEGVEHNGIPLEQVNKAKRIEIGTAIHMAMNPTLRVMFVDANAFDAETEKAIEAAVKDKDYQLFEEVVEGDTGIVLEDGTLKE